MIALTQIQEIPQRNTILLLGPPGAGKSTFCHQAVLRNIETKPVIFVTTEYGPSKVINSLREVGMGEVIPHELWFIDAFNETVGLESEERSGIVSASCQDLTSLNIAISRLRDKTGKDSLLIFDSLTSPYMFNGPEILRFIRLSISRFAAEGNSVLVCIDEGCGKEEDLVSMMSAVDGIVKIELMNGSKTINIIKHPKMSPMRIDAPMTWSPIVSYDIDWKMHAQHMEMSMGLGEGPPLRTEVGDYVNIFWANLARWSCMLWDPKRFPTMIYNSIKKLEGGNEATWKDFFNALPWRVRLLLKLMPKNFSKVKDMKKLVSFGQHSMEVDRAGVMEYLEKTSKTDEHHIRIYESDTCWGFENSGVALGLGALGMMPGFMQGFEKFRGGPDREWNVIETKCIGLGDPYCEIIAMPGEINELKGLLESVDSTIMEKIHGCLLDRAMGFMIHGKPLCKERTKLGNEIGLHEFSHIVIHPAFSSERYLIAMRLGGAISGKRIGECLNETGMREDEAVQNLIKLLEYCKVGKISIGETLIIEENCESFTTKAEEPSCFFTTGFLNGFFSTVKNQHVKETRCIAMGDPYCEWEFR